MVRVSKVIKTIEFIAIMTEELSLGMTFIGLIEEAGLTEEYEIEMLDHTQRIYTRTRVFTIHRRLQPCSPSSVSAGGWKWVFLGHIVAVVWHWQTD